MHHFQRQKDGLVDVVINRQDGDAEPLVKFGCSVTPSPEHWSRDPFNSFPIKMQPYMHELLYLCKSTVAVRQITSYKHEVASWYRNLLMLFDRCVCCGSLLVHNRSTLGIRPNKEILGASGFERSCATKLNLVL